VGALVLIRGAKSKVNMAMTLISMNMCSSSIMRMDILSINMEELRGSATVPQLLQAIPRGLGAAEERRQGCRGI